MKTVGVIGGLGPMATVRYLELITKMADAAKDQEHPRIFMESLPDIPDRTRYILGETSQDPLPVMREAAEGLQKLGADFLTIPCITAHYFYDSLVKTLEIPVIHLPRCVAESAAKKGVRCVGILATTGTIRSQVLEREFAAAGVETIEPEPELQEQLMHIIYGQVKKGVSVDYEMFCRIAEALLSRGAEKLVLGCTELPLLKKGGMGLVDERTDRLLQQSCIDVLEVLAQQAVLSAGAPLKAEYRDVIR